MWHAFRRAHPLTANCRLELQIAISISGAWRKLAKCQLIKIVNFELFISEENSKEEKPNAFSFELPFYFWGKTFAAMAMLHAMRHAVWSAAGGRGVAGDLFKRKRRARLILSLFSGPPKKT